jgi:hypothetical protein
MLHRPRLRGPGVERRDAGRDTHVKLRHGHGSGLVGRSGFRHCPARTRLRGGYHRRRGLGSAGALRGLGSARLLRARLGCRRRGFGRRALGRLGPIGGGLRLSGSRHGRLRRRRGRRLHPFLRQQRERIDVAVGIRRDPDAEMDVGLGVLGGAARPDRPEGRALRDGLLGSHAERAEVDERDRVAVGRLHRDGSASAGNRAGEADDSCRRREDGRTRRSCDVDAAVLPAGVGIVSEDEGS